MENRELTPTERADRAEAAFFDQLRRLTTSMSATADELHRINDRIESGAVVINPQPGPN